MSEKLYLLKFRGELVEGFIKEEVRDRLVQTFAISVTRAEDLLSREEAVLKRKLSLKEAFQYAARLRTLGLVVAIENDVAEEPPAPPASVAPPSAPEPQFNNTEEVTVQGIDDTLSRHDPHPFGGMRSIRPVLAKGGPVLSSSASDRAPFGSQEKEIAANAFGVRSPSGPDTVPPQAPSPSDASPFMPAPEIRMGTSGGTVNTEIRGGDRTMTTRLLSFEFNGNGAEYFKIWIVNIFLSILTLGIYSAWAKVRTQRYFYGNTRLDGTSFEYLADPIKILKGRIIAAVLLLLVVIAYNISPLVMLGAMLLVLMVTPWIVCRACHFKARYSSWRGVRFHFSGNSFGAARAFFLWQIGGMLFAPLMPAMFREQMRYVVNNMHFGGVPIKNNATTAQFYTVFLKLIGIALVIGILGAMISMPMPWFEPLVVAGLYFFGVVYIKVSLMNLRYDGTTLGQHSFQCTYELGSFAKLFFVNTILTILTLGLFRPFAMVRNARYAAEHIDILAVGNLDEFIEQQDQDVSAAGSEIGDLFDIDVGF